jgi:hypothetical protein
MRAGVALVVALLLAASPAQAQEIKLTGPLRDAPTADNRVHYLPFGLRGDLVFGATGGAASAKGHDLSRATGVGGSFRYRAATVLAWELQGALLRGMEDASERRLSVTPRFVYIFASALRMPEWELFVAAGPSLERNTTQQSKHTFVGAELALGIDRRVDPVFNRFIIELVLADRRDVGGSQWSPAAMLRIGIMTTFGIRQ